MYEDSYYMYILVVYDIHTAKKVFAARKTYVIHCG
jgi:hypothetical protein